MPPPVLRQQCSTSFEPWPLVFVASTFLLGAPLWVLNGTACAQAIDLGRVEPHLLEHLVVVFAEFRSTLCGATCFLRKPFTW